MILSSQSAGTIYRGLVILSEIRCSQGSVISGNSPGVKAVVSLSTCCHLVAPFLGGAEESKVGLRVHTFILVFC